MWLMGFEFGIMRQFKPGTGSAGKVTMLVLITIAMWCVTAYYLGFMKITIDLVVPSALTATSIANFVLAMIDKNGNTYTLKTNTHLNQTYSYNGVTYTDPVSFTPGKMP